MPFVSFSEPVRPQELILPAELFYASDNCTDISHLEQIQDKFQSALQSTIRMQDGCASNPGDCLVEQVTTTCHHKSSDPRWQRIIALANSNRRRTPANTFSRRAGNLRMRKKQRTIRLSDLPYVIPVQFKFATRVSHKGRWPDQYHKALKRLLGMFDYFERQVIDRAFALQYSISAPITIREVPESLTFAREISVCEIGYEFQHGIKLCG